MSDVLQTAAALLGADFDTFRTRSTALHTMALALVSPAPQAVTEARVLLVGALTTLCRESEDPIAAFDNMIATLQERRAITVRTIAERDEQAQDGAR